MEIDNVGRCIYTEDELCTLVMQGINIDDLFVKNADRLNEHISKLETPDFRKYEPITNEDQFHKDNQDKWLMPNDAKLFDIESHLKSLCKTAKEINRVEYELSKFKEYNLLHVLRYIKYMIDVFKSNDIVWGIGRGSSVASYCLYLLECHSVDSILYDIDFDEFLK